MRGVAAQVASKEVGPPRGAEHEQSAPVTEAAAACPVIEEAAVRGDEAPKKTRSRPKVKPRKPAKRSKVAANAERSCKQGKVVRSS